MHHMYKYVHHIYMHLGYMHHGYVCLGYMHHGYMHDMKVKKEVVVTSAWVTRPERLKGAKDEVKRPEGPPTRSQGPEGS